MITKLPSFRKVPVLAVSDRDRERNRVRERNRDRERNPDRNRTARPSGNVRTVVSDSQDRSAADRFQPKVPGH